MITKNCGKRRRYDHRKNYNCLLPPTTRTSELLQLPPQFTSRADLPELLQLPPQFVGSADPSDPTDPGDPHGSQRPSRSPALPKQFWGVHSSLQRDSCALAVKKRGSRSRGTGVVFPPVYSGNNCQTSTRAMLGTTAGSSPLRLVARGVPFVSVASPVSTTRRVVPVASPVPTTRVVC